MSDSAKKRGRQVGEKDKCEILKRICTEQAGTNGKKGNYSKQRGDVSTELAKGSGEHFVTARIHLKCGKIMRESA